MRENVTKRILAVVLAVFCAVALLPSAQIGGVAKADVWGEKTVAGLGSSVIKPPKEGDYTALWTGWTGSYVWYGKYDGTPVRYRVLTPKARTDDGRTTRYTTMLLDCDRILYYAQFDEDGYANQAARKPNEWAYSDVRTGLKDSAFLTKENGFTTIERDAITKCSIGEHELEEGTSAGQVSSWTKSEYGDYVPTAFSGEKVFLLDVEDVSNSAYGYYYDEESLESRKKWDLNGNTALWWLRSANNDHDTVAGVVLSDGGLHNDDHDESHHSVKDFGGVSPAFNINLSSVIFSSVVCGTAGEDDAEYKLTLADPNIGINLINQGKDVTISGNEVYVPYSIYGTDSANVTQVSVLILDKEYEAGNGNEANILYYGRTNHISEGTCRFTIPSNLSMWNWDGGYFVYLLAEDMNGIYETDYASEPVRVRNPFKNVAGLGTSAIKAPKTPENYSDFWTGSYVWFGKYNGTPVKYRVLAPKTTIYGGTTMLLDCDSILYYAQFDGYGNDKPGTQNADEWAYSDVKAGLNGDAFLNKSNAFTTLEKDAIAESTIASHALVEGTSAGQVDSGTLDLFENYVGLSGEKIFLLDAEDVSNSAYGYHYDVVLALYSRIKKYPDGNEPEWWLRSVGVAGLNIHRESVIAFNGVSPAFNINLSSVIFSSVVYGTAGQDNAEYKLTLADQDLNVGIASGEMPSISEGVVTVPYMISGANASNATQVSVLILDSEYQSGEEEILYYGKLNTGRTFSLTGTGTFALPDELSWEDWGTSYYVYLLAEDENGVYETDYASAPVRIRKPVDPSLMLVITEQPENASALAGTTATFTITAAGNGPFTYQWQYRKNNEDTWKASAQSGNKTATLSVAATNGIDGYQFRCVVTDCLNQQMCSEPATLRISPKITLQPKDTSVIAGSTATFTVTVTGEGTLTYQWQYRKNDTDSWKASAQSGNKTATLSVATTNGLDGYQFRCVITDGNKQKTYTKAATLTISPRITSQPKDASVPAGSTAAFSVTATGTGTLTYQWQYRKNDTDTWKASAQSGNKTATLSVATTNGLDGYQFRCVITDGNKQKTYTKAATLTISPRITSQPKDASASAGSTATFSVTATGTGTLTYLWQFRKNESASWTTSGQSGYKTATLSVATTNGLDGYQFRCVVKDGNRVQTVSNAATLTVQAK